MQTKRHKIIMKWVQKRDDTFSGGDSAVVVTLALSFLLSQKSEIGFGSKATVTNIPEIVSSRPWVIDVNFGL